MGEDLFTARLSELLQRARATGAPQEELDALMDTQDPREAVVALLQRRERRGLRQLPALFDAERVGPEALPPEGWLEVLAVEGYVTFPAVLTPELTALLAAELRAGGGGSAGGAPGPCVDALLDTGFVRALVSGALGAQYELCHHTVAEDSPAPALLPPSGLQHDGLQQEHWQPEGRAPWAETGFAAARAYLRVAFFAAGCPREAALAAVPGSCVPSPSLPPGRPCGPLGSRLSVSVDSHAVSAPQLAAAVAADPEAGAESLLRSQHRLPARQLYLPPGTLLVMDGRTWRGKSTDAGPTQSDDGGEGGEEGWPSLSFCFKLPSPPHPSTAALPEVWQEEARSGSEHRAMLFGGDRARL